MLDVLAATSTTPITFKRNLHIPAALGRATEKSGCLLLSTPSRNLTQGWPAFLSCHVQVHILHLSYSSLLIQQALMWLSIAILHFVCSLYTATSKPAEGASPQCNIIEASRGFTVHLQALCHWACGS